MVVGTEIKCIVSVNNEVSGLRNWVMVKALTVLEPRRSCRDGRGREAVLCESTWRC